MRGLVWIGIALALPYLTMVTLLALVEWHPNLFVNWSASAPVGLWRLNEPEGATLRMGQWVVVCPPVEESNREALFGSKEGVASCPTITLLKQVAALPGDSVTVDDGAIATPLTEVHSFESHIGKELPRLPNGEHSVSDGRYWVINDHHPLSIDSRYFGPVTADAILALAEPKLVFDRR